jgi:hypothetical protein
MFYHEAGLRRITMGPGDDILIPPRYIHAVVSSVGAIMLSVSIADNK